MIWAGTVLAILSMVMLCMAWRRPRRSAALNALAWGAMLAGLVLSGLAHGAWGLAVAGLAATTIALLLLIPDAVGSEARVRRMPARGAPDRAPLHLGRRIVTFLLTVPIAFIAALLLSVASFALADLAGWYRADSVMLALMLLPIWWALLATVLLMKRHA